MLSAHVESKSSDITTMLSQVGVRFPTVFPIFSGEPNQKAINEWIDNHKSIPEVQSIVKKLANNINYISHAVFLQQLKKVVNAFNQKNKPYILLIAQAIQGIGPGCSDLWVAGMAVEHCGLKPPVAVARMDEIVAALKSHPDIRDILIVDDASYSGSHISLEIGQLLIMIFVKFEKVAVEKKYELHIGIPFITNDAKKEIEKKIESDESFKVDFLPCITMPMMKEILSQAELDYLAQNFDYRCSSRTLTYFDHRFPDLWSSLWCLSDGYHLLRLKIKEAMRHLKYTCVSSSNADVNVVLVQDVEKWNSLVNLLLPNSNTTIVPSIISPYRLHDNYAQEKLKKALEQKTIGKRTHYPVPSYLEQLLADCEPLQKQEPALYTQRFFKSNHTHVFLLGVAAIVLLIKFNNSFDDHEQKLLVLFVASLVGACYKKTLNGSIGERFQNKTSGKLNI